MNQSMQRCPNCSAYVMSDDNICPRCDQPLNQSVITDVPITEVVVTHDEHDVPPAEDIHTLPGDFEIDAPEDTPLETETDSALNDEELKTTADSEMPADALLEEDRANLPTTRLPNALPIFRTPAQTLEPAADEESAEEVPATTEPINADEKSREAAPTEVGPFSADKELEPSEDVSTGEILEEESFRPAPAVIKPPAPPDLPEPLAVDQTLPHLEEELRVAEPQEDDTSELPTARLTPEEAGFKADETARQNVRPAYFVPPAPYTPPPVMTPQPVHITPPPATYGYGMPAASAATAYLQQRVQAYRQGGYRLHVNSLYEATLSYGKELGAGGWLLALLSVIGFFWYLLLMALGGFQRDIVDIVLESDGRIYEDGSGAAHIRQHRSRVGRRWAMFGAVIFVIGLVLIIGLGLVAGAVLRNERYQAALREAYPAVTLFEEHFSTTEADPADVNATKDGAVAYAVIAGIAVVGLWGGATLWVIGTIHAKTYRVHVPPLPGW